MIYYRKKSDKHKHQSIRKHLNFESVEQHNDIIEIRPTEVVKQTKDKGKKIAVKPLPTRRSTRHVERYSRIEFCYCNCLAQCVKLRYQTKNGFHT